MEFDENLVALISDVFPLINRELDAALESLYLEVEDDKLREENTLLRYLTQIVLEIFHKHERKFNQIGMTSGEFMRNLQQNSRPILHYLKAYPRAYDLISSFFKILGKKRGG